MKRILIFDLLAYEVSSFLVCFPSSPKALLFLHYVLGTTHEETASHEAVTGSFHFFLRIFIRNLLSLSDNCFDWFSLTNSLVSANEHFRSTRRGTKGCRGDGWIRLQQGPLHLGYGKGSNLSIDKLDLYLRS